VECVSRHPFSDYRGLSSGSDLRPALLRELTDLYVQKPAHTPEEVRLFTELALRLIEHVDAAERAWVGARLAPYPGAPLVVIQRLAEPDAVPSSAQSEWSRPTQTQNLPRIEDTQPQETLSETFFNASASERRLILRYLDYAPVSPALVDMPVGIITQIEQAAIRRRPDELVRALAQALSISLTCANRIVDDTTGEAVIAALKALAVPSPALQRILLFLDPAVGQSPDTYFALVQLYDDTGVDTARRLVAIWRRDHPASRKGGHRPELIEDQPARARDFARHDPRPVGGNPSSEEQRRKGQTES
jgi:hypothetical protein